MPRYREYMLTEKLPHTWCAGCGHGIILQAIADTFAQLELRKNEIALVSGIGCFGRVDDYLDINCLHVTHGRALPVATGVALAGPDLTVLVTMGDGDGATIGGNHLIHAARRNINVTAVVANNLNYGQTGGQYSSTTPCGSMTATSAYGHIEDPFDVCQLVMAAGATYVARGSVDNPVLLRKLLADGIRHRGFSLIEVMEYCPTHFGRKNRAGSPADMIRRLQRQSVTVSQAGTMTQEELEGRFIVGCLRSVEKDDYHTRYAAMAARVRGEEVGA